ncbi:AMP-binding protein [Nitrosomonas communis]|uniref:1-acyl-sn-glycerol-3-phosphate acyltransferases n=1 Tax=Nitrosomonas communis TaxID=44574 RepID=A0A1H2QNC2_9PROT|nr:AMP-binding protein [Nitrosomonas communis]SDW08398.1 1-acyl-sn-glycerol-3-phosphate acyltransferases [Nitrosomonas communis]
MPFNTDSQSDVEKLLGIARNLVHELRPNEPVPKHLGLDHSLERDFGLDSLARVELLSRIERELGVKLGEKALAEAETPRDLLKQIAGTITAETLTPAGTAKFAETQVYPPPPETASTLIEILDWRVARQPEQVHITLYDEEEHTEDITYRRLQEEAKALAAGLQQLGLGSGKKIAIMLPTGRGFFAAFYGALYAGCVPVPLYPPGRPSQIEDHMRRIADIIANAQASILITVEQAKPLGHLLRAQCESLRMVTTVADLSIRGAHPPSPKLEPQDIALLQYTSGSTGSPKGVVLTHANLLANLRAMTLASGITAADTFVSWLPLYHDMGLIAACMGSLYVGFRLVLRSPLSFLARPACWLWTINRHCATVSAAPNFAYELCANKLDDRELNGLDLSCWRLAYNGAEPISVNTIEHFVARFSRYGFSRTAMTPVYGLAESSVGLAFPPAKRGPLVDHVDRDTLLRSGIARCVQAEDRSALHIVSCGLPLPDHQIRIVDADGQVLPERTQGRVQFRGPSATSSGYFCNPEATARLFDGQWLNSGDMGYIAARELYLTGREKDIIIRGGHNIYPQELEEAVSKVRGIHKGGVAVFPASNTHAGTERLIILAETHESSTKERERIVTEINNLAVDLVGLPADDIVLVPPRTVLKTSSGKLRRTACRELYEQGAINSTLRPLWWQMIRLGGAAAIARVMRLLRRSDEWAWGLWAWAVFVAIVPFAWLLIVLAPGLTLRRRIARASARLAVALTGLRLRVEGLQHLDSKTPMIVVANHASYLDALLLTAVLPAKFAYVAKQELRRNPTAAIPLRRLGSAFVERFDDARGVEDVRKVEERARAGESIVFFPEGTFRREAGLMPFRMGAFLTAARTGIPILPVTLIGTRTMLCAGQWLPRRSKLKVLISTPLHPLGNDWQAALQLQETARRQILAELSEPDIITATGPTSSSENFR